MVGLTIDGKHIEIAEGATILKAAGELGIDIPTLCHHQAIQPYQVCRVCLVEIIKNGESRLVPSCGYKVEEGMAVLTNSERVIRRRKMIVELILAEAPHSEKVIAIAKKLGIEESRFEPKREKECILCGLCVRICNDVVGNGTIAFAYRGANRQITTPYNEFNDVCSTCGACAQVCPTRVVKLEEITTNEVKPILSSFDANLSKRPCIYVPFPQAVPNKPVIDRENCMYFKVGRCKICEVVCQPDAINYDQEEEFVEEEVGAIVVATGYDLYPIERFIEYGGGTCKDVVDGLQFERLLSASGPTNGEIRRPSDNKIPKRIAFISCVGSRDPEHHLSYCSKICCMYNTKHALLYKERVPDGEAIIFSIDIRTAGKGYEEFFLRAKEEENVLYVRGKPSRVMKEGDGLVVWTTDTLTGRALKVKCDMVVLSTAVVPSMETLELAKKLRIQTNVHGFFNEAHPKLRPVESLVPGFFLAGSAQAPKDIPETIAQASAAASKVLEMFSKKEITAEPMIVAVDEEMCSGCKLCVVSCPYEAREFDEEKKIVKINEALCMGCGSCVAACPSGASQQKNLMEKQLSKMVEVILGE
jgi:heterodisulfide reductase subunit A